MNTKRKKLRGGHDFDDNDSEVSAQIEIIYRNHGTPKINNYALSHPN